MRMHKKTAILWVNLYRIVRNTSEHDKAKTLIKPCCIGKGDFTLKAEQLDAIKCIELIPVATHGICLCRLFSTTHDVIAIISP